MLSTFAALSASGGTSALAFAVSVVMGTGLESASAQ